MLHIVKSSNPLTCTKAGTGVIMAHATNYIRSVFTLVKGPILVALFSSEQQYNLLPGLCAVSGKESVDISLHVQWCAQRWRF
jgi:hypothetical protein